MTHRSFVLIFMFAWSHASGHCAEPDQEPTQHFVATDSLERDPDQSGDVESALASFRWKPTTFDVTVESRENGDSLIRFPSPLPVGDAVNDQVAVEWFPASSHQNETVAPAVVVVHESGKSMTVGRIIAKGLSSRGVHAGMVQLPYYGYRRANREKVKGNQIFAIMRQAIGDVRRARDAIAAMPGVDPSRISVQGTSLGGFVASVSTALDDGFDHSFLLLSGGDLYDIVAQGAKDAAKVRDELLRSGLTLEELQELAWEIEPNRFAHRLRADRTWLYSGNQDSVVPIANALSFAETAKLDFSHHIRMPANHYSGVIFLPMILDHIAGTCRGESMENRTLEFPSR